LLRWTRAARWLVSDFPPLTLSVQTYRTPPSVAPQAAAGKKEEGEKGAERLEGKRGVPILCAWRAEADRPIWRDRAGAIVRRRRPRGGLAWPRGRREAAAGGWTTREAAAYSRWTAGEAPRAGGWRRARDGTLG
jgi:hypothetical protein